MKLTLAQAPEWNAEIDEISAGVYRAKAQRSSGCCLFDSTGQDSQELVARLNEYVVQTEHCLAQKA